MKRALLFFLLGILFLTFQTTLLRACPVQIIRPDFVFILTIYLGLSFPPISGGILAFLLGYLMDLFSGNAFGLYTLSRPLLFYAAHFFKNRFYLEGFLFQSFFVFLFVLLEGLLILVLLAALNPYPHSKLYPSFLTALLPQSIFTGLITPILFGLFQKGSVLLLKRNGEAGRQGG